MAIVKQLYLYCDQCPKSQSPFTVSPGNATAAEARAEAKRQGWSRVSGLDLCEEHTATRRGA